MANQILKYFILVFTMLFCDSFTSAARELDAYYGRSSHFSMGYNSFELPDKMSIRADKANGQIIEALLEENLFEIDFIQHNPYMNRRQDGRNSWLYFAIDSSGNVMSNPDLSFDLDLFNTKRSREFLVSYGNIILTDHAKEKILQLVFDPSFGRPMNLSGFTNLETVMIDRANLNSSNTKSSHSGLYMEYMGDPFLLDEISQITSLENLIFYAPSWSGWYNLILMNGPKKELFELPNLKSITLAGVPYLPIPGNEWQKIEYFHTDEIFYPELVNLALVFKHFEKDTSYSNWHEYLEYGNDSIPFSIPENGTFQTFYKNGSPLCKGNYVDGLPHGEWNFWYEDGKLCEHRIYENGKREGNWYFLLPTVGYYYEIDTILKLDYKNDTLVHRQDRCSEQHTGYDGCYHSSVRAPFPPNYRFCIVDYKIEYKQNHEMSISKEMCWYIDGPEIPSVQIPVGSMEIWNYTNDIWTYTFEEYCDNKKQLKSIFLQGRKGENAYYSFRTNLETSSSGKIYKKEYIVDLQNCFIRESHYEAENDTAQVKLRGTPQEHSKYLPCEK